MEKSKVEEQIIEILKKYTKDPDVWHDADLTTDILGCLDINSSRFVDIIMDVEDTFHLELEDKVVDDIETIQDVINAVIQKLG